MQTVSILIAAYNAENFIHRAIESCLNQTILPHEIIVVNDCSSDKTKERVEDIGKTSTLVKIINLPANGGPAKARNAGLKVANGSWIAILDADDAIDATYVASIMQAAGNSDADIISSNFYWFDIHKNKRIDVGIELTSTETWVNKYQFVSGARPFTHEADYGLLKPVFKAQFLKQNNLSYPEDLRHGEDFMVMAKCLFCDAKFLVLKTPLYLYTTRSSGLSKTTIAYKKMAKATLTLLTHDNVKGDKLLASLIKKRAYYLKKFNALVNFNNDLTNDYYKNYLKGGLLDKHYFYYLLQHGREVIKRRLRIT